MPQTTIPTTHANEYLADVTEINNNVWAVYQEDTGFISQWKLDDISSGSGIDSVGPNHMNSSGSPTQVAGYFQSSGVDFDGVDDCFWIYWTAGSGLHGPEKAYAEGSNTSFTTWGIQLRVKIEEGALDQERVIMSKWNDVGLDKEWMWGINPSGGFFVQWKRYFDGANYCLNSSQSGLIADDGEWHSIGMMYRGRSAAESHFMFFSDNQLDLNTVEGFRPDDAVPSANWASGIVHIGAADYGRDPSGFFKGSMEDVRFFNRRGWTIPEWNAYASGLSPATLVPRVNEAHPNLIMHIPLDVYTSGTPEEGQDQWKFYENVNEQLVHTSGAAANFDHDYFQMVDGPSITARSGLGFNTNASAARFLVINKELLSDRVKKWNQGFTVGNWIKTSGASVDARYFGFNEFGGPFVNTLGNSFIGNTMYFSPSTDNYFHNPPTPTSLEIIPVDEWVYVMNTLDFATATSHMSISGILGGSSALSGKYGLFSHPATDYLRIFRNLTGSVQYSLYGGLSEIIGFDRPLTPAQMSGFFVDSSGLLAIATAYSGIQTGGYAFGIPTTLASGELGGYVITGTSPDSTLGGYTSGIIPEASGRLGGYVIAGTPRNNILGGYMPSKSEWDATLGGYLQSALEQRSLLGAYSVGSETTPVNSEFFAFFNLIGRNKEEFDAQVEMYKALREEFDAQALIYIDEQKPGAEIIDPNIPITSGVAGSTISFEAQSSGLDGKDITLTYWYFSDDASTSGSNNSASGTYTTEHTFPLSGIFDVVFTSVDNMGVVNSDRVKINTASGLVVPEISLTATPETGVAPLSVGFSGVISSAPNPIVESYLSFGDGTFSASTTSIYKLYPVVGCYIPVFRVRDDRGVVVTDTTVVGVNN
jgi:hypothetical protein